MVDMKIFQSFEAQLPASMLLLNEDVGHTKFDFGMVVFSFICDRQQARILHTPLHMLPCRASSLATTLVIAPNSLSFIKKKNKSGIFIFIHYQKKRKKKNFCLLLIKIRFFFLHINCRQIVLD